LPTAFDVVRHLTNINLSAGFEIPFSPKISHQSNWALFFRQKLSCNYQMLRSSAAS
jgi:hypothetical protein